MANKSYLEKFKDPKWQKLRLEVFKKDNWRCRNCGRKDKTLNAHHTHYKKGSEPWEYDMHDIVTLCDTCHEAEHSDKNESGKTALLNEISDYLKNNFIRNELSEIYYIIRILHDNEILSSKLEILIDSLSNGNICNFLKNVFENMGDVDLEKTLTITKYKNQ